MGNHPRWSDDYEWSRLSEWRVEEIERSSDAVLDWLRSDPVWLADAGARVLLVDLDNLRAGASRWRARMALVVALARSADHVVIAGQRSAVDRAHPHLAEFADTAIAVPDGLDLADHVLLDGASAVRARHRQTAVLSNDGIFAALADDGPLLVVSPGADALSERLVDAAHRVLDLTSVERLALTS